MAGEETSLRASWGISSDSATLDIDGVVTSFSFRRDGQTYTEKDSLGAVDGVFIFDFADAMTLDVLVQSTEVPPETGAPFECGDFVGWVKSSEIAETNSSYRRIHIEAESTMNCVEPGEIDPEDGAGIDASGGSGLSWDG